MTSEQAKQEGEDCDIKASRYIGVAWQKSTNQWRSTIKHQGKKIFLGTFEDDVLAAQAFDRAAIMYRIGHTNTNFPIESYPDAQSLIDEGRARALLAPSQNKARGKLRDESTLNIINDQQQRQTVPVSAPLLEAYAELPTSEALMKVQRTIDAVMSRPFTDFFAFNATVSPKEIELKVAIAIDSIRRSALQESIHQSTSQNQTIEAAPVEVPELDLDEVCVADGGKSTPNMVVHLPNPLFKSKYRGVSWIQDRNKWRAQLRLKDGKNLHLGYFLDPRLAAYAYDRAAIAQFGPAVETNFPVLRGADGSVTVAPPADLISPTSAGPNTPTGLHGYTVVHDGILNMIEPESPAHAKRGRGRPKGAAKIRDVAQADTKTITQLADPVLPPLTSSVVSSFPKLHVPPTYAQPPSTHTGLVRLGQQMVSIPIHAAAPQHKVAGAAPSLKLTSSLGTTPVSIPAVSVSHSHGVAPSHQLPHGLTVQQIGGPGAGFLTPPASQPMQPSSEPLQQHPAATAPHTPSVAPHQLTPTTVTQGLEVTLLPSPATTVPQDTLVSSHPTLDAPRSQHTNLPAVAPTAVSQAHPERQFPEPGAFMYVYQHASGPAAVSWADLDLSQLQGLGRHLDAPEADKMDMTFLPIASTITTQEAVGGLPSSSASLPAHSHSTITFQPVQTSAAYPSLRVPVQPSGNLTPTHQLPASQNTSSHASQSESMGLQPAHLPTSDHPTFKPEHEAMSVDDIMRNSEV